LSSVALTGNGNAVLTGTIYAASSEVSLTGNGSGNVYHSRIIADTVSVTGRGDANVDYDPNQNYPIISPPVIELTK